MMQNRNYPNVKMFIEALGATGHKLYRKLY